jgi:hypothetical protein
VRDEGRMHRLWYDLRSQALFDDSFRADVLEIDGSLERMIWRIVSRYAELLGVEPTTTPSMAYSMFDGAFQMALLRHLAGQPEALAELGTHARMLLAHVTCTPVRTQRVS